MGNNVNLLKCLYMEVGVRVQWVPCSQGMFVSLKPRPGEAEEGRDVMWWGIQVPDPATSCAAVMRVLRKDQSKEEGNYTLERTISLDDYPISQGCQTHSKQSNNIHKTCWGRGPVNVIKQDQMTLSKWCTGNLMEWREWWIMFILGFKIYRKARRVCFG